MFHGLVNNFETVVWPARYQFLAVFFVVLTFSYSFLVIIDFIPEAPTETAAVSADRSTSTATYEVEAESATTTIPSENSMVSTRNSREQDTAVTEGAVLPVRMEIDALNRSIPVLNPTSRRIDDLDDALLHGAVRHPDAADFAQEGTIFILGHSSRLPNVMNRNFQIFNDIEKLEWGDTIRVYSETMVYVYRVDRVYEAKASQVTVPIAGTGPRLTLATCDSFGSRDDRFIVEAELQSSRPIDA